MICFPVKTLPLGKPKDFYYQIMWLHKLKSLIWKTKTTAAPLNVEFRYSIKMMIKSPQNILSFTSEFVLSFKVVCDLCENIFQCANEMEQKKRKHWIRVAAISISIHSSSSTVFVKAKTNAGNPTDYFLAKGLFSFWHWFLLICLTVLFPLYCFVTSAYLAINFASTNNNSYHKPIVVIKWYIYTSTHWFTPTGSKASSSQCHLVLTNTAK